jgi:hypothetical protein
MARQFQLGPKRFIPGYISHGRSRYPEISAAFVLLDPSYESGYYRDARKIVQATLIILPNLVKILIRFPATDQRHSRSAKIQLHGHIWVYLGSRCQ